MTNEKRLLLINPPFPRKVSGVPLQLLYLASAVKGAGMQVEILDLDIEPYNQRELALEQKINDFRPNYVGVTAYSPNYPESLEIMKWVKSVDSSIITISGGPHEIATKRCTPKPDNIDYRVKSTFGENTLLRVLGVKAAGRQRAITDRTPLFPAFELLKDSAQYQFDADLFGGRKNIQLLSATGCSQTCDFCSAQVGYRPFDPKNVTQQLERVIRMGYGAIFFNDPNFTDPDKRSLKSELIQIRKSKSEVQKPRATYERVLNLMDKFIQADIPQALTWGCQTKASLVTPEVLEKMAEAGCRYITYALETVDEQALKTMRKGVTVSDVETAVKNTRSLGMKVGLYVMLGSYQDQNKTVFVPERDLGITSATLDFVEMLRPDYLSISILARYPMRDRIKPGKRLHTHLDYANQRYSREPVWLNFDEGWGAFHPTVTVEHAQKYLDIIQARRNANPRVWNSIRRF